MANGIDDTDGWDRGKVVTGEGLEGGLGRLISDEHVLITRSVFGGLASRRLSY